MKSRLIWKSLLVVVILTATYVLSYWPLSTFEDHPSSLPKTKFLGHKGSGSENVGLSAFQENSLAGANFGLSQMDGIELDIQMSKSGTLYCFHGNEVEICNTKPAFSIPSTTDEEIKEYEQGCDRQLQRLDQVLDLLYKQKSKVISLDVKGFHFVNSLSYNGYMTAIAEKIVALCDEKKVSKQTLVESDSRAFHQRIKSLSQEIECYYSVFNWPNRGASFALTDNLDGISLKFNAENATSETISLYHKKGLKIQVWTVNDHNEIQRAIDLGVDYIQTDDVTYLKKN